jgi:drug/metabolite transporter (DMT)-like permease
VKKPALFASAALGLVWGCNFLFVKWAAVLITPAQITLLRVAFGFAPVLAYALAKGALRREHLRHAHHFVVMALLATAVYYDAFARGTARLPSSVAGMLSGAIPLFTFLCAWAALKEERITAGKGAGIAMGLLGVLLIARPWSATGGVDPQGVLCMVLGSLSVGASFVYARRFLTPLKLPAVALTTYQIGLGLLFLLAVTPLEGVGRLFDDTRAWTGLVFGLGLLGTGMAYIAYYFIVERLGAIAASSVTYIPPVVALLIGVLFVGESIPATGYAAIALILAGVGVLQLAGLRGSARGKCYGGPIHPQGVRR